MSLRPRCLPRGWYPDDPDRLRELVSSWTRPGGVDVPSAEGRPGALAAVAPHAGWVFSGRLAALAAASLAARMRSPDATLVVFGGHLAPGSRPLAARESGYDTPLGPLAADLELLRALESALGLGADAEPDNTVEVLLPIVAALYPGARVLWLRAPNDPSALELGRAVFAASSEARREVACLGSTDLTHYGPNYGFSPKGLGAEAERWVTGTNDRRFIQALLALDGPEAIRLGEAERSACSPGAAAAALAFALAGGADRAALLGYGTSLEARRDDSFVGYAAISFSQGGR